MRSCVWRRTGWWPAVLALVAWAGLAGPVAAQGQGRVIGTVLETGTNKPLAGAQVFIPGTGLGALTGQNGHYVLGNVPAGRTVVRVTMLGYSSGDQTVTVSAGETAQANFTLHQTAIALNEVVVTGAGVATERRKLGNTVASVDVSKIMQQSSATSVTQVLQSQIPGVSMVSSGGMAGEGMRIRIRGDASLTQYNQPIVYVDGVRVSNGGGWGPGVSAGGVGGASRLADINPDDIARIEVLKGAAAATLYGTEASSGVIEIFTKHGSAGPTRYNLQIQAGILNYPNNAWRPLAGFATTAAKAQYLTQYWGKTITPYKVFSVNPIPWLYETGHSNLYSLGVSGGSNKFTYHVSGRWNAVNGPVGGKKFAVPGYQLARDLDNHKQANASLTFFPTDKLRFRVTSMYTEAYHEVPNEGNTIYAPMSDMLYSKPENAGCGPASNIVSPTVCKSPIGSNLTGSASFGTVQEAMQRRTWQNVQTFEGSLNGNWQITPQVVADVTFGVEHVAQRGVAFQPFRWNVNGFAGSDVLGNRSANFVFDHHLTFDGHVSWDKNLGDFSSSLVVGSQIFDTQTNSGWENGNEFPGPGIQVVGAGALQSNFESYLKEVQVGVFGQEQVGWKNFAFLTVGARFDRHSAFGANAPSVVYPKASISIVPSSLPSWSSNLLSTFRVRAAIGQSGRQPGAFDKFTTFAPQAAPTGPGLIPGNLGNQNLKPEVSTEWEGGTELGFLGDRIGLDVTYWHRVVNNLLYSRQYAPSGGFIATQLSNIGQMKAHGLELSLKGQVLSRKNVALNLFVNGAYLHEIVTSLGGAPPIKVEGAYPRPRNFIKVGYAPSSFFGAKLINNPIPISVDAGCTPATKAQMLAYLAQPINPTDIHVLVQGGDPGNGPGCGTGDFLGYYLGKPIPDWTGSFGGTLTLLKNFEITANFEYKTGHFSEENLTDAFRRSNPGIGRNTVQSATVTSILENPASTAEQRYNAALIWAKQLKALSPLSGLNEIHPADYIRFRELDLTYNLPTAMANRFHARTASITLSGRNIAIWTRFPYGVDPELNGVGITNSGGATNNFEMGMIDYEFPIPQQWSLAARVSF